VQRAVADPHEPDLGVRVLSAKALRGGESGLAEGVCACLDIYGNDLAAIPRLHLSAYLSFVDLITTPGGLFGAVVRLLWGHAPPVSNRKRNMIAPILPDAHGRICHAKPKQDTSTDSTNAGYKGVSKGLVNGNGMSGTSRTVSSFGEPMIEAIGKTEEGG